MMLCYCIAREINLEVLHASVSSKGNLNEIHFWMLVDLVLISWNRAGCGKLER